MNTESNPLHNVGSFGCLDLSERLSKAQRRSPDASNHRKAQKSGGRKSDRGQREHSKIGHSSGSKLTSNDLSGGPRTTVEGLEKDKSGPIPEMYQAALDNRWSQVASRCGTHAAEARYVHKSDGTTALHLAIISRARHAGCYAVTSEFEHQKVRDLWDQGTSDSPAPLSVIRALVSAGPSAARQRCLKMGYTPLAYACLVPPLPSNPADYFSPHPKRGEGRSQSAAKQTESGTRKQGTDEWIAFPQNEKANTRNRVVEAVKELVNTGKRNDAVKLQLEHGAAPNQGTKAPADEEKRLVLLNKIISGIGSLSKLPPDDIFKEAEAVVRALIDDHDLQDTLFILSDGSCLSPLEIHIISYSQQRGSQGGTVGECSSQTTDSCDYNSATKSTNSPTAKFLRPGLNTTAVLRVLLEGDPSLVKPTRFGKKALDLLYRCNSSAILDVLKKQDLRKSSHHKEKKRRQRKRRASTESGEGEDSEQVKESSGASSCESAGSNTSKKSNCSLELGSWWLWKWTILLLKYSSASIKKRGTPFLALHAAANIEGCPLPMLLLSMRAFPQQMLKPGNTTTKKEALGCASLYDVLGCLEQKERKSTETSRRRRSCPSIGSAIIPQEPAMRYDEKDTLLEDSEFLPLHLVCCWGGKKKKERARFSAVDSVLGLAVDTVTASRKAMAISALVQACPESTGALTASGRSPLWCALESRTRWEEGVQKLVEASPTQVTVRHKGSGLYPVMFAASLSEPEKRQRSKGKRKSKRGTEEGRNKQARDDLGI
eukprot:CAMPEP_0116853536 /NCGR_PEP_ID=MMETSP0418-20121206/17973_1 /TAXON_ID=1158023 /ORGANISM="Astrosyne radiata, Strain 13vi08-1A" /LENGTH=770 /DNA_ID=CAMNT_0004485961 /DNA_START=208 /DNA_END=2517 /DNA_ORIENTATION=-